MMATCTIEVNADSEEEASNKAEDEVLQWDAGDFNSIDITETHASFCQQINKFGQRSEERK